MNRTNNIETRFYINGFEFYRKERNGMVETERESLHILNLKQPEELQKEEENNNLNQKTDFNSIFDTNQRFVLIETLIVDNGSAANITTVRYQYGNHLGSACLELDETGRIISYEEYHPFGTTSYRSGRSETEVSLKRYKYCGKERDEQTGFYYYGMRYYAAWLCRFVSVDPLQFKYPYYTPYQYAGNKPVTFIDLDGGEEEKPKQQSDTPATYTVKKGDSPSSIAGKFGVSVWDLAKNNQGAQEGGGFFSDIGEGNYNDYWVEGKGTSWSLQPGDVLNLQGTNIKGAMPNFDIKMPVNRVDPMGGLGQGAAIKTNLRQESRYTLQKYRDSQKPIGNEWSISPAKSEAEKNWEAISGVFGNYIKLDPVINAVATGGAVYMGGLAATTAAPAIATTATNIAPTVYSTVTNAYNSAMMFSSSTAGKFAIGITVGVANKEMDLDLPPDVALPDPVTNTIYQATDLYYKLKDYLKLPIDTNKRVK